MPRILVIDDDVEFMDVLCKVLRSRGYEVYSALNGKDGVNLYKETPVDLVITDILMPEQDGVELIFSLRKISPEVKIILISGGGKYGTAEDYLHSAKLVCDIKYALTKPFSIDEMIQAINGLLNK